MRTNGATADWVRTKVLRRSQAFDSFQSTLRRLLT